MLMSLPNSVGIDPASAKEDVFKASGRLVLPNRKNEQKGAYRSSCCPGGKGTAC
jgi:hypothetical protein